MQEKFDGRRTLIRKGSNGVDGINRKGLIVSLPSPITEEAEKLPGTFIIDGECLGDKLVAFDVLLIGDTDVRSWSYQKRLFALNQLILSNGKRITPIETATTTAEKTKLFQRLKDQNKEGAVFKRLDAPYTSGRPASGGDQLKYKFYETASFIVGSINEQRSVTLQLLRGKSFVSAGNVTIPPNHEIPKSGNVVEVRYLYAFRESGCIYQPVFLGTRADIDPGECLVEQLKFKTQQQEEAA